MKEREKKKDIERERERERERKREKEGERGRTFPQGIEVSLRDSPENSGPAGVADRQTQYFHH